MNQHQVNIRSPDASIVRSSDSRTFPLRTASGDFRNNEHFTPADTAFLDSVPHFGLVVVALPHRPNGISVRWRVSHTRGSLLESRRANTQLRHLYPVVQHDTENGRQCIGRLSRLSVVGSSAHNLSVWFLSGNTFVGYADQHPLVSVIDYDTVTPILHTHSQFSVYALYKGMGVTLLSDLLHGTPLGNHIKDSLSFISPMKPESTSVVISSIWPKVNLSTENKSCRPLMTWGSNTRNI